MIVLVLVTLVLERKNLEEPMLGIVLTVLAQTSPLAGLADIEDVVQAAVLLGFTLGMMSPLLVVLFATCRWGDARRDEVRLR